MPALRRAFDYVVPDDAHGLRIGTIVRVPLHGRNVRGWVVDTSPTDVPAGRLLPLRAIVSAGPPADVVDVCRWAARRWAGPLSTLLRAASPPNVVAHDQPVEAETAVYPRLLEPDHPWAGDALVLTRPGADLQGALRPLLAPEGSTLVLVPASADAPRLGAWLRDDGREVVVLTSDRPAADLTRGWRRARGGACVVVGGRTAVWAPVPDLATVVVVDDADEAYVEERAPTWNARDVAFERARRAGASVRVVTPTPSVEALTRLGEPTAVPAARLWPRVDVVDVRDQEPGQALLTRELADALHRVLDRGERSVCVLNRRGRARLLACRACGELARCERCGATVAESAGSMVCAVCGTARPMVCLHCAGARFRGVKPGVAKVRDDLAALLPRASVDDVDASTDGAPDADVLIGTEAVLHRVERMGARPTGLVAYLELDQELLAPRVRAAEQALWLVLRGARLLAPRLEADHAGTLLLQTRLPEHEVVLALARTEPMVVTRAERDRRASLGFPPFGGLAALSGEAVAVDAACTALRAAAGITVLGPVDQGRRALARAATWDALADALAEPGVDAAHALGRLRVDVDPHRAA